jgi:germination protein M
MGKKKTKGSGAGLWLLGVLACLAAGGGLYYYVAVLGGGFDPPRKPSVKPATVIVTEERKIVLYLPRETRDGFVLKPVTRKIGGQGSILDAAVNALLATSKKEGLVGNLIPKGTRLLGPVTVDKGVAQVNLSKDFVNNFSGGSDLEVLTLNSLVATVVDSSGGKAERVRIQVEGKSVESLGGHMDLTEALTPDPAIVKSEKGN